MDSYSGESNSGASVYTEAKQEYTKQLTLYIVPAFHKFFMNLLKQASSEEDNVKRHLWKFQELLSQIPEWNIDRVQRETTKIVSEIQCDYLEELVTAVFIAHTKVLTAIRIGNKNKKVQITIPKLEHFIHRALSESSRLLWSSAYLFDNNSSPVEKQKNHRQIETLLHDGVGQAIRGLLPVKSILKDYLSEPDDGDDDKDDDEATNDETTKDETTKDDTMKDETTKDETTKDETTKDDTTKDQSDEKIKEIADDIKKIESNDKEILDNNTLLNEKIPEITTDSNSDKIDLKPVLDIKIDTDEKPTGAVPVNTKPSLTLSVEKEQEIDQKKETSVQSQTPVIVVSTEPSVRFTDFDQVYQPGQKGEVKMDYVPSNPDNDEELIIDDHASDISEFEDLNEYESEPMTQNDYETL